MINIEENNFDQSIVEPRPCDQVYDYYNGALSPEGVKSFEKHLIKCTECEKTIFSLDRVLATLSEEEEFASTRDNKPSNDELQPARLRSTTKP